MGPSMNTKPWRYPIHHRGALLTKHSESLVFSRGFAPCLWGCRFQPRSRLNIFFWTKTWLSYHWLVTLWETTSCWPKETRFIRNWTLNSIRNYTISFWSGFNGFPLKTQTLSCYGNSSPNYFPARQIQRSKPYHSSQLFFTWYIRIGLPHQIKSRSSASLNQYYL